MTYCDRCGIETDFLHAEIDVRYHFMSSDRTLFGGILDPGRDKRTLCPACFRKLCEAMTVEWGGE